MLWNGGVNSGQVFDISNGTKGNAIGVAPISSAIEDVGDGWYRCSVYNTNVLNAGVYIAQSNTSAFYQGDGTSGVYIYGAQIEQDATYPTSYIPTYGVSQTRLGDVCVGAGNVNTFNSVEGVLFLEASALFNDLTRRHISISDGSTTNRVVLRYDVGSNSIQFFVQIGGLIPVNLYTTNYTTTDNLKMAVKYKSGDYKLYINGQIVDSSTNVSAFNPNTLDTFEFARAGASQPFYGKAKQVLYFPTALSDDECIALTS